MKSKLIKQFLMTAVMALSLFACNSQGPANPLDIPTPTPSNPESPVGNNNGSTKREWTYMVYMGADNSLAADGINDLIELEMVGSTDEVAIVVQAEFPPKVKEETFRVLVEKDSDDTSIELKNAEDIGNVNMADTQVMADFIKWAAQTYPAKNYAFVVWDHGAGWKSSQFLSARTNKDDTSEELNTRGAIEDATSQKLMSLPELAQGIRDSGIHFSTVDFDACNMGMYEVAYEYLGLTDYMIFAEETVPGPGNPYDLILGSLTSKPQMTGEELAVASATQYSAFYTALAKASTTKSVIDMAQLETLHKKIGDFTQAIVKEKGFAALAQAATGKTQQYAFEFNHDIFDVMAYFSKSLPNGNAKKLTQEINGLISTAVILNKIDGDDVARSHGLAIYLPTSGETTSAELKEYGKLAINKDKNKSWKSFIEAYLIGSGTNLETPEQGVGGFGAAVTSEGCDADVQLYVYEPRPGGESGQGDLYANWMGDSTPNGTFETESDQVVYMAKPEVTAGEYTALVRLYQVDLSCAKKLKVHFYVIDPQNGINDWTELNSANGFNVSNPSPQPMDLGNAYDGQDFDTLMDLNGYSDYWVPASLTRSTDEITIEDTIEVELVKSKRTQMIIEEGPEGRF